MSSDWRWNAASAAWLLVAALTVVLFLGGMALLYGQRLTVCPADPCGAARLPAEAQMLAAAGVSLQFAARYEMTIYALTALVHVAVAAVLFWRRSDDPMALFVGLTLLT